MEGLSFAGRRRNGTQTTVKAMLISPSITKHCMHFLNAFVSVITWDVELNVMSTRYVGYKTALEEEKEIR